MHNQKKALEYMWKDSCTITVRTENINPETKLTEFEEKIILENQACKLSFERLAATDREHTDTVSQFIKLFLPVDVKVPPGSKITVTRNGQATDYVQSGQPGIFTNHQEIALTLFRRWA